ncbi:MAG: hypothetical protein BGO29_05965 [Bacteroidales bacterium 36-12]|jgi:DNA-binding protein HU-beta|nr:MAG: hypothetical protein BGO29_05965 [Bacteroidales bacterium 36-12]
MKHKELINSIALKLNQDENEISLMTKAFTELVIKKMQEGNTVNIQGFGAFEFKRRDERLSVHPATQMRTLIPPKQVVSFRPSTVLKNKLKDIESHE